MKIETFRYEECLRDSFLKNMNQFRSEKKDHLSLRHLESDCSQGRADLVLAHIPSQWSNQVCVKSAKFFRQPTCSRLLSNLKPLAVRSENLLKYKSGVSLPTLRYWINRMTEVDLIEDLGEKRYKLGSNYLLPNADIFSYEFKLTNWKRALYQATRYRSFSHRVFVVMPPDKIKPALEQIDIFKMLNIGIMSHDIYGETNTLFQPRKMTPISKRCFLMALGMLREDAQEF